ncbi:hypothetical protein QP868_11975, partial [Brevibacterium sp. UMB1308A]|uniref:hypothetical protein n=1 Tax=Brevibacterium sp. UMB1308A TaxID=3050608 RepID=UPI002551B41B
MSTTAVMILRNRVMSWDRVQSKSFANTPSVGVGNSSATRSTLATVATSPVGNTTHATTSSTPTDP